MKSTFQENSFFCRYLLKAVFDEFAFEVTILMGFQLTNEKVLKRPLTRIFFTNPNFKRINYFLFCAFLRTKNFQSFVAFCCLCAACFSLALFFLSNVIKVQFSISQHERTKDNKNNHSSFFVGTAKRKIHIFSHFKTEILQQF